MIVQTDPRAPRVVLVGPPGAGKTTIGRKLAKELGVELYDTDAGIERETGRTIPEIFAADGEPEFRKIEERVVRRAILAERGVVSLGGGAVLSKDTRALLRGRTVVYLEISVGEGLRRTGASTNRPLLNGADPATKYRELMRKRRPLYREVATVRVRTDGRSPGRVVKMVLAKLGFESANPDTGTDVDCSNLSETTDAPTTTAGEGAGTPQGSSRSRARRRARARAAARRREAAEAAGEQTPSAPMGKSAANAGGRSWRTRRAEAHAAGNSAANDAAADETTVDETTAAKSADSANPTGRWRTRRAAAPDDTDAAAEPDGTEESSKGPRSSGRARRARARRARVRARKIQEAQTESEQQT
ncbi:shikimate kinase [Nocardia colli]|uniref:Shikimate kinase n=1 Tax=Nocardia colli TaxID=2545717 RepID=A0A5N0E559_9NOCA|nr:shikimate kinase [Nocardia colli]